MAQRCLADCGSGMAITTHRIKFRRARKIAAAAAALATATAAVAAAELFLWLISLLGCVGLFVALRLLFVRAAADLHFICDGCSPSPASLSSYLPTSAAAHQAWVDDDFGKVYEALSIVGIVGIARISTDCVAAASLLLLLLVLLLLLPQSTSTGVAF